MELRRIIIVTSSQHFHLVIVSHHSAFLVEEKRNVVTIVLCPRVTHNTKFLELVALVLEDVRTIDTIFQHKTITVPPLDVENKNKSAFATFRTNNMDPAQPVQSVP